MKEVYSLSRAQNRFFSSMSHEIRTPINTIVGLNEMILREDISDEVADEANNIRSASRMLLHIVNDVLDMSKLNTNSIDVISGTYSIGDMLSEVVGMLWIKASEKKLDFHIKVNPDVPAELVGDEAKIKQILINLITNAIKYTREGEVTLFVDFEKKEGNKVNVIFKVSDTGMGIKEESLPHLFSAYKRVDQTENRYIEGTGLGLSIVKEFTDLMGGDIKVESVYGEGSVFTLTLPQEWIEDDPLGEMDPFRAKKLHSNSRHGDYHSAFTAPEARILVVDDNSANILVVKKLLRDTGVIIDSATSGTKALLMTLENPYDLIFMDHLMPEIDGVECMHRIKEQVGGMSKNARIVALTANAGENNRAFYYKEGFDGYLLKPVTGEELEKELYQQLPRRLIRSGVINIDTTGDPNESFKKKKKPLLITTEGVCDLPEALLKSLGIPIVRYMIHTEGGDFIDGIEADAKELVTYINNDRGKARSGPPDVSEYEKFFVEQLKSAQRIIHIVIAKNASRGFGVATEAAKKYDNVIVADSGHLSSGMGLVVLHAYNLAQQGASVEEVLKGIEAVKEKVHTTFVVDSTDFLLRSGRINKTVNRVANALLLHPVLTLKRSRIVFGKVIFGDREQTWKKYINNAFKTEEPIDRSLLFITYVALSTEELRSIKREVDSLIHFDKVIFQVATPAIAANSGPGTFGLLYRTV